MHLATTPPQFLSPWELSTNADNNDHNNNNNNKIIYRTAMGAVHKDESTVNWQIITRAA